jgi:hypothetical protein
MSLRILLRPLLPTWRFFEDVGVESVLYCRSGRSADDLGPWAEYSAGPSSRSLWSLFLNPSGNLELAKHALVEGLMQDLPALGDDLEQSVSYKLVKNLAWSLTRSPVADETFYQFKISRGSDEVLVSPVYGSTETKKGYRGSPRESGESGESGELASSRGSEDRGDRR